MPVAEMMTSYDIPEDAIENFISFTNASREKAIAFLEVGTKDFRTAVPTFRWLLLAMFRLCYSPKRAFYFVWTIVANSIRPMSLLDNSRPIIAIPTELSMPTSKTLTVFNPK